MGDSFIEKIKNSFIQYFADLKESKSHQHLIAGGIAGPISRTVTAPLDRVRLVIQISSRQQTMWECYKNLVKEGGIRGLWRGNGINVLKVGPEMALRFGLYDHLKFILKHQQRQPSLPERFAVASTAGVIANFTIYPMEVLKTRLTIRRTHDYRGILHAISHIYQNEGWRSFYSGYRASCLGIIPYTGVELVFYEALKKRCIKQSEGADSNIWRLMGCATASTTLGQCSSYPFYIIKTRLQGNSKHPSIIDAHSVSIFTIIKRMIQVEGLFSMYRGMAASLLKVIPAGAINYAVYEEVIYHINKS